MLQHVAVAGERVAEVLKKLFTIIVTNIFVQNLHDRHLFKPGARPQLAEGRLWARVWFTEIVFVKVCVCTYLCLSVRTHVSKIV